MSDLVRSEVEAALAFYEPWADDAPQLRAIVDAARAWLAEGDATPEAGSLSTPTEPTDEPDYEAAEALFDEGGDLHWLNSDRLAVDVLVRKIVAAASRVQEETL